jgi:uncharacterized protein (DUF486 family)
MTLVTPVLLLILSNIFMTFAWYGHLRSLNAQPIWIAVAVSWGIAFFEYCFQVPANRLGYQHYTLPQLKVMQEVLTMVVFAVFSTLWMGQPVSRNFAYAGACLIGAVYFIFKKD